jgi:addiction module RelE/StbE family toxin
MNIVYDPNFLEKLKKVDVRVRRSVKERILLFYKNHNDLQLDNHPLRESYLGYRSIDINSDYRAIYKEVQIGTEAVAYFVALGTHKELYEDPNKE